MAQAAPAGIPRWRYALLCSVFAVLPDIDLLAFFLGIPYTAPLGHRGLAHSLLFAAVVAGVATFLAARTAPRLRASAGQLYALTFAATASHGLLDATTNGGRGVALLAPFSDGRFFFPLRPIVVSPIHPERFLSLWVEVLTTEAVWVWLPLALLSMAFHIVRLTTRAVARISREANEHR